MRRRSFTLVELLVVIAIISVLAAMLLPALRTAQDTARRGLCMANVRQFVLATHLYSDDRDDIIPNHFEENLCGDGMASPDLPYLRSSRYFSDPRLLICPTAPSPYPHKYWPTSDWGNKLVAPWNGFWNGTGAYNTPMGTYYYWGGNPSHSGTTSHRWCTGCSGFFMKTKNVIDSSRYAVMWDQNDFRNYVRGTAYIGQSPHQRNHGANYAFHDGHVEWVPDSRLTCTLNSASHGAEDITPIVNENSVRYWQPGRNHGTGYGPNSSGSTPAASTVIGRILQLY